VALHEIDELTRIPRIGSPAPAQAYQEDNNPCNKEENAHKVKLLDLLPLRVARNVKLCICWRKIEELIEDDCDTGEDDAEVVRPTPSCCCVGDELSGNYRSENWITIRTSSRKLSRCYLTSKRQRRQKNNRNNRSSVLIRHQLSQNNTK
jgi:hypothetical protein